MQARLCIAVVSLLLLQACSRSVWQRTGYETLQTMQAQQCEKALSADCPERMRYEEYQQQRSDAQTD